MFTPLFPRGFPATQPRPAQIAGGYALLALLWLGFVSQKSGGQGGMANHWWFFYSLGHIILTAGLIYFLTDQARRRLSQQYWLLFDCHPHPLFIFNLQTLRFLAVNQRAIDAYGYSHREFSHLSVKDIGPPEDMAPLLASLQEHPGSLGEIRHEGVWRHCQKDGTVIMAETSITRITFGGRPAWLMLAQDVTEISRQLQQALQERTAELQERNSDLEFFASAVSHNLRAPLRHIYQFGQLLAQHLGTTDPTANHYLQVIQKGAEKMDSLTTGLLAFCQLAQQSLNLVEIDLGPLVAHCIKTVTANLPRRPMAFKVDELPRVLADPMLLEEVFTNLISNGIKFHPPGELVQIRIGVVSGKTIFVADRGVGFDQGQVERLFQPFSRLHPQQEFPGLGIGLALTQRIIQRHGGRIWAEGVPGQGATFYLDLPGPVPPTPD